MRRQGAEAFARGARAASRRYGSSPRGEAVVGPGAGHGFRRERIAAGFVGGSS